jgi:DNA-binding XRE family transcriptional regulator
VSVSLLSEELVAHVVEVLRDKREGMRRSKKRLAADAGVSRTAIILMESRKRLPSLELVIKLSMGLDEPFSAIVAEAEKRMAKKLVSKSLPPAPARPPKPKK